MNHQYFRMGTQECSRIARDKEHTQEGYLNGNAFQHCALHRIYREMNNKLCEKTDKNIRCLTYYWEIVRSKRLVA